MPSFKRTTQLNEKPKKAKKKKNARVKFGMRCSKLRSSFYSERMDASDTMMKMINLDNPLGPEVEDDRF